MMSRSMILAFDFDNSVRSADYQERLSRKNLE